jgi:alginate O-acetyltransferase complex protein AlgI
MVFSSITFIFIFLPIFLFCYFIIKDVKKRNLVLLLFSLAFYAWGEPFYIFLIILSILINYYLTKKMDKNKSKGLLFLIVFINILFLFSFKYVDFFINNINSLLNTNIPLLKLSLPIGISFYTFQALSYVIDVYRGKVKVQNDLFYLACYIVAFPQLIAGPIVRYETIEKELVKRKTTFDDFYQGTKRFIIGLAKKALIANSVAFVADQIFNQSSTTYGFIGALIGSIAYTLQIYFDFSGYSDMAIGMGKMLGFNYNENFNYPYMATSITDFWRRWHISLSSFFKDYVYIPLGGNRKGLAKQVRNILIVWLLTGLWHGASWNFVLWGLYYAIFLLIEKFILKDILEKTPKFVNHLYTLIIVLVGWVIFRGENLETILDTLESLIGINGLGNITKLSTIGIFSIRYIIAFILGIIFSTDISKKILKDDTKTDVIVGILFVLSIITILVGSYNPFIYFRF